MLKFRKLIGPLAAVAVMMVPMAPSASAAPQPAVSSAQKIHPFLQVGVQDQPLRIARVIVQKQRKDARARDLVSKLLGSTVVEEFNVVPAFVLDIPQGLIPLLAASPDVRYISPDGAVEVIPQLPLLAPKNQQKPKPPAKVDEHRTTVSADKLVTTYPFDAGAPSAWSGAANWDRNSLTGANTTVAVIDSGVDATHPDLSGRVVAVNVNRNSTNTGDGYGHGTHVAGVIAGNSPADDYLGIAPNTTVVSVKVTDDSGAAFESDLLRGMDWVYANKDAYRIRVANLSVTTSVPESYATSPIDAAVESLFAKNVTIVAAAGNLGDAQDAVWYAPGNDPLAITVGCLDDNGTVSPNDDSLCDISSRGVTEDGFAKPDVVAPGRKLVSSLSSGVNGRDPVLAQEFADRVTTDGRHIRLSGTSMSAPVVAGAIALLLERQPGLTPDQLRQILVGTAKAYPGQADKAGNVNIPAAIAASQHPPARSQYGPLPVNGARPPAGQRTLVWDGGQWGNAFWSSAHWDSAHWDSAHWDSAYWDSAHWDSAYWDSAHWDSRALGLGALGLGALGLSAHWDSAHWDSAHWDSAHWDSAHWDSAHWDASRSYD